MLPPVWPLYILTKPADFYRFLQILGRYRLRFWVGPRRLKQKGTPRTVDDGTFPGRVALFRRPDRSLFETSPLFDTFMNVLRGRLGKRFFLASSHGLVFKAWPSFQAMA